MNPKKDDAWKEAKRRCRLNEEDIRMAKELGFQPKSLIKNIPDPSQRWKAPVNEWIRSLYEEKFGARKRARDVPAPVKPAPVIEFRNPDHPWPDKPEIAEYVPFDLPENDDVEWGEGMDFDEDREVNDQNDMMLRRQCRFRWAAQFIAVSLSKLPEVQKLAAFGAVAQPLEMELPRFRQFRSRGIEILHECGDLDLAVWMTDLGSLRELKNAMAQGLSILQGSAYGGVAHHQVDMHLMDAGTGAYAGRLCIFGQCPKAGKRECLVPNCGAKPFLQQFPKYRFNPGQFECEPKVILFDRASGFLVRLPNIKVQGQTYTVREQSDDDAPF